MIIPILMLLGGLVTVRAISRHATPQTKIGSVSQTQPRTKRDRLIALRARRPHLFRLLACLKRGDAIDRWLVNAAMREAYDRGDVKTVAKLHRKFGGMDVPRIEDGDRDFSDDDQDEEDENGEPREASQDEDEDDGRDHDHEQDGEYLPDGDPDDGTTVIGKEASGSPLEGVDADSWGAFVDKMATQPETYQGPNHVGKFHQSKLRLKQLGIDISEFSADKQYEAFVKDISDLRERGEPLIRAWECHPVKIDQGEQVATLSGILAVLKSAGIEKARSWFESEADRKKFAKTTEMFTKANGAF